MNVLEKILEEIDVLEDKEYDSEKYTECFIDGANCAISDVRAIIRQCMNVGKDTDTPTNNGWIPCSERLPSKEETFGNIEFIVMIEGAGSPTTLFYNEYGWHDGECNFYEVIAWQQLPEPYKPDEPKQQKNTQQEMEDFWRDK